MVKLEEVYQKKTQLEHIKDLPDTYIGSVEKSDYDLYVHNGETICKNKVTITPGLYKIFDEILVNAIDHHVRTKYLKGKMRVSLTKVWIDKNKFLFLANLFPYECIGCRYLTALPLAYY